MVRWGVSKNRLDLLDVYCDIHNRLKIEKEIVFNNGGAYFYNRNEKRWGIWEYEVIFEQLKEKILSEMEFD